MNKFSQKILIVASLLLSCSLFYTIDVSAQINGQPPEGASCVVSVGNRNAPLAVDGSYLISNIPGNMGAVRARATCSDGSLGQSGIGFTDATQSITIALGPIDFSRYDPVPIAAILNASESQLNSGDASQLSMSAISLDGTIRDVTSRSEGTTYTISNSLLATITNEGLVTITGQFDTASSARIVASATTEGSVSSTYMYTLGPRGTLIGTIYYSDGITPVESAQVSVLRLQPMELAGTAITNTNGQFELTDINAGGFVISVLDPTTGNRALSGAKIESEGETVEVSINLNGLGQVNVTVLNDNDEIVTDADVTLTALGAYVDVRTAQTNAEGIINFANVTAGEFTVSTRDSATGLLGAIVSQIDSGETIDVTLRLQETGTIQGQVFDVDGTTLLSGVQVRVLSRQRGVVSQTVTGVAGNFSFDTLPKSDGPFILDAFVEGRLRGRVPGIIYSQGDEVLERDIVLSAVGTVSGLVKNSSNIPFANAVVTMQSLDGLRLTFDALSNEDGLFMLPAVPVGDFELTAITEDGQTARASGRVDFDGDNVVLDLVVAGNTIVGTVFERDGVTPVAAGVSVYLASKSAGEFYSYSNVNEAISTITDMDGRYGFPITEAGDFYVQAEQNLDRGRSRAILVNLDPSQPLETNIVFLAKGSVTGVVTDANGVVQNNLTVTVFTQGAFDVTRAVITNNQGQYNLNGVFAGEIVVSVQNTVTGQSGIRQARLDAEGQQVAIDIVLSASGAIHGQILKANGEISDQPIKITVLSNGVELTHLNLDDGQSYQFVFVPLGDVKIIAEELITGNIGVATTRLDSLNENKEVDVDLIGQGQLIVELLDEDNQPVAGAIVTITTRLPFRSSQEGTSDINGIAIFHHILAGDYSVSAIKEANFGSLQGSYTGTMLPDVFQEISVQMEAVAVGSISGIVYKSDGITPQGAGWVVRMLPEPYRDAYIAHTNDNGEYGFDQVNAGSYNIDVYAFFDRFQCPIRGRIRARTSGVSLTIQDEQVQADLQFIGAGEVFGVITDNNGNLAPGIKMTLTSPDPIYGLNSTCSGRTTYVATTNSIGEYRLLDIPAGNFTMLAENSDRSLRAQNNDRIRFDTDEVEMNLTLIDNVVTLPYSFYDANGFLYDINGDGSIGTGTRSVFASAAPDNAGMRLEIVTNDIPVPFFNGDGTLGRLIAQGQELEIDDDTASGLFVSRRIFTPRSGYFSRYLEVLENPTNTAITVDVRIKSHHRTDDSNPRVVDTSDGDQALSVANPALPDRWVVVDDQTDADPFENSSIPATGHVFDGPGASAQVASATYELIGQTGRLIYQWDDVTVEPGEQVILMHFTFGQIKRTGSRQAAMRLMNLPPEAIDDLTTDDRDAIINFDVPLISQQLPLPNLSAGQLSGRVLSGNGVTSIPGAQVIFESQHPLFGRIRYVQSNSEGEFEFLSTLDGTINNYVIPVFGFNLSANYSVSGASSALTPGSFPIDTTQTIQDVIFIGKGDVQGSVLRHNGATVAGTSIVMCKVDNRNACYFRPDNRAISNEDGSYVLYANTPRDYFIYADKSHPQNFGRNIHGNATVTATAADVSVVNIILEETGSISGIIRAADGTPVSEAEVILWDISGSTSSRIRRTVSDTAGFYRFFDVPLGEFEVRAKDVISNATGSATTTVFVDQESTVDVDLLSTAILNVMVQYERGILANDAIVVLNGPSGRMTVRTDSNGLAQFQVFTGHFELFAQHPDRGRPLIATDSVDILASDDVVEVTMTLPAAGEVSGTIRRPDGTTLASGFPYNVTQIRGLSINRINKNTDQIGAYRVVGLPVGDYIITAFDAEQDRFADAEFSIIEDGHELTLDLTLLDERIALPANLYDVNRFKFDVQQDGSLLNGSNAFSTGAAMLTISGQAFTGDTSARLQAGRRQFAVTQDTPIFGLDITRKIYVPRGAYFARYIEVLDNPTNADITVDVKLTHGMETGEFIQTSTNDIDLSLQDYWFMIDDDSDEDIKLFGNQMPPTVHLFTDAAKTLSPAIIDINYTNLMANIQQQWSEITIPAGQRVSLMHVFVQQINRVGAEYAVNRLSQLPPELLNDMTLSDIETIVNFDLPTDGVSQLESLPPLTASISGAVFEASDANPVPVPQTRVTVQSMHPLFSRIWGKVTDSFCSGPGTGLTSLRSSANDANYSIQGQLTDVDSIAIPAGVDIQVRAQEAVPCYLGASGHPFTNAPSRSVTLEASGTQNVIFDTSVITGTVTGSAGFSVTGGRVYRSIDNPDFPDYQYVSIAADGSYIYPGVVTGDYDLLFDTNHPSRYGSDDHLRGSRVGISVPFREVFVSDVLLQPTGSVQGTILAFDSAPAVNAEIILTSDEQNQDYNQCESGCDINTLEKHKGMKSVSRRVFTDSQGLYNFSAIPTGIYSMQVTDPVSGGISNLELTVVENQVTVQNLVLTAVGSATITVNDASNNPIIDSVVYIYAESEGVEEVAGRTDFLGQLVVANIPLGNYDIRVSDPRAPTIRYMDRSVSGNVASQGQANAHTLNLRTAAIVEVTVINSDNAGNPVANANISISDAIGDRNVGHTDAFGILLIPVVPEGEFSIAASFTENGNLNENTIAGQVNSNDDNVQIDVNIDLRSNLIALPTSIRDANNSLYQISGNEGSSNLPKLLIDGVAFVSDQEAITQLNERQLLLASTAPLSGLEVTRKLYVPTNGYFIRYIEVLNNPTSTSISIDLEINSTVSSQIVLDSSNGDNVLDNGATQDLWFTSGYSGNSSNNYAFATSGANALLAPPELSFLNGSFNQRSASAYWSNITIPANSRIQILHFYSPQSSSASASASAQRLVQLPPETLTGLIANDVSEIINFNIPIDLISQLDVLPELTGTISGRVFEGDGVTTIENKRVKVKSNHLLFNNIYTYSFTNIPGLQTDENGQFSITGDITNDNFPIAIPVNGSYTLSTSHSISDLDVAVDVAFASGETSITQDLIFATGSVQGVVSGAFRPNLTHTNRIYVTQNGSNITQKDTNLDGSFNINGLESGIYRLETRTGDYSGRLIGAADSVSVTEGLITTQNIVYPANGAIGGQVFSNAGIEQPNILVELTQENSSFFREIRTNASGGYEFGAVPVGDYRVTVTDSNTSAQIPADVSVSDQAVTTQDFTFTLIGSANINVFDAVGDPVIDSNVYLTVDEFGINKYVGKTDVLGQLVVLNIPLSDYMIRVEDPRFPNNTYFDKMVSSSITTANQLNIHNVILTIIGSATIKVSDAEGSSVIGSDIYLIADAYEINELVGDTDVSGQFVVPNIPLGDYTIKVQDPRSMNNTYFDKIVSSSITTANQLNTHDVVLSAIGSALITVLDSINIPVADSRVYIDTLDRNSSEFFAQTDSLGEVLITVIPIGDYTVRVTDPRAPLNSYMDHFVTDNMSASNQTNSHQFNLRVAATIQVTVTDTQNNLSAVPNASVSIVDVSGQRNVGITDAQGMLDVLAVPEGSYSIDVSANVNGESKHGTISGTVTNLEDNQVKLETVDLIGDPVVRPPYSLYDINRNSYRINGNPDPKLLIDGVAFAEQYFGNEQLDGRQYVLKANSLLSGLNVKRKVFVPLDGYFVRYIEVLENPTNSDITIAVEVNDSVNYKDTIFNSSNGDTVIDNGGVNPDLWFVIGEDSNDENYTFITSGENAELPAPTLDYTYISSATNIAKANWSNVIVPANSTIQLLHFYSEQTNQASATASAERLVQLPPEALTGISINDIDEIVNFSIPVDLISSLPAFDLTGSVSGQVFEGDGVTTVANSDIAIQSSNIIYNRIYNSSSLRTDIDGNYSFISSLDDTNNPVVIPLESSVTVTSKHPENSNLTVSETASFPTQQSEIIQDLIFATGQIQGSLLGIFPSDTTMFFSVETQVTGRTLVRNINATEMYNLVGLESGDYNITAEPNTLASFDLEAVANNVNVTVGQTTNQDIQMPPNGAISGIVYSFEGNPVANQSVELTRISYNRTRRTTTDVNGYYQFDVVPVGNDFTVTAIDSITGSELSVPNIIVLDQQFTNQDITLLGVGSVTITATYPSGVLASNLRIEINTPTINNQPYLGRTDSNGQLIADIAVGTYTLFAGHPDTRQEISVNGEVLTDGEASNISIVLPANANVQFTVIDSDQSDLPIANSNIRLSTDNYSDSGNTNANGQVLLDEVHQGSIQATVKIDDDYQSVFMFDITSADDGQTLNYIVNKAESLSQINTFETNTSSQLYQVDALAGDLLSLSIRRDSSNYSCRSMNAKVFDPNETKIAEATAADTYQNSGVELISILNDGRYTVMIEPTTFSCASGNYEYQIGASIAGQAIAVQPLQGGSQVSGTLLQADGVTGAANEIVRIRTLDGELMLDTTLTTDVNGSYVFEGVPLGNFELSYVADPSINASGTITTLGEQVVLDLMLSPLAQFSINVQNADGTPINTSVQLTISASDIATVRPFTDDQGRYVYNYLGDQVVGFNVTSPSDSQISANQFVQAIIGQTIEVNLILIPSVIAGVVYEPDGVTPVANVTLQARYSISDELINSLSSDTQGAYSFDSLPNDNNIVIRAYDPVNNVIVTSPVITTTSSVINQDIQLIRWGRVFGKLTSAGDLPIANVEVGAYYNNNTGSGFNRTIYSETNSNGEYSFDRLPINQNLLINYTVYDNDFNQISAEEMISLQNHGDQAEVNLLLPGSVLTLQLSTADGLEIGGNCDVNLATEGGGEVKTIDQNSFMGGGGSNELYDVSCDARFGFNALQPGEVTITVTETNNYTNIFTGTYQLVEDELVAVNHVFSVIKGNVTFNDSSVVQSAQVSTLENMVTSNELGNYRIIGHGLGVFRITAEDTLTGLQTSIESEMVDVATPVILDLQLPASGTINGQVLDVLGLPMTDIEVYANSSESPVVLQNTTNINGDYSIGNITVGNIELSAVDQVTNNIASAQTQLDVDGEIKTQNLQFTQPGSVSGILTDENTIAVSAGCVQMQYTRAGIVHQGLNFNTSSDVNGDYSFSSASSGSVMVTGLDDCNNPTTATIETSDIISNTNTTVDLQLGNAAPLMHELNASGAGFGFKVYSDGSVQTENNVDQFIPNHSFVEPLSLSINGMELNSQPAALLEDGGLEIEVGPTHTLNLVNSRKVFAPTTGNYVRLLDSVTNTSLVNQQIRVSLQGLYGTTNIFIQNNTKALLSIDPITSNNHYAIQKISEGYNPDDLSATTGYVFADVNDLITVTPDFEHERFSFAWSWNMTIQPGETLSFLSYILVNAPEIGDVTILTTLAEELVNGTQVDMYNGLSIEEKANIVNFGVPQ